MSWCSENNSNEMQQLRFILRKCFYSTCFGWQSHPSSGVHVPGRHDAEQQDSDYLQLHTTHTDRNTTLLRTNLLMKCACLPVAIYSTYSWWWVGLSPETCRVKATAKNKPQLLHLGIIFTTKAWCTEPQILSLFTVYLNIFLLVSWISCGLSSWYRMII